MVTGYLVDQIINVINANGFDPLLLVKVGKDEEVKDLANYMEPKIVSSNAMKTSEEQFKTLVLATKHDNSELLLPHLTQGALQNSILHLTGKLDKEEQFLNSLIGSLRKLNINCFFYMVYQTPQGSLSWNYVMSIKDVGHPIIGPVSIMDNLMMHEEYNLQGMLIQTVDILWHPLLFLDCDSNGKNCKTNGLNSDVMKVISLKLNFTWESVNEFGGRLVDLGLKNGTGQQQGSIKGIFELMARGDYPLTTVGWLMVEDRLNLFEFIPVRYENRILAMKEAKISIDYGLGSQTMGRDPKLGRSVLCCGSAER